MYQLLYYSLSLLNKTISYSAARPNTKRLSLLLIINVQRPASPFPIMIYVKPKDPNNRNQINWKYLYQYIFRNGNIFECQTFATDNFLPLNDPNRSCQISPSTENSMPWWLMNMYIIHVDFYREKKMCHTKRETKKI